MLSNPYWNFTTVTPFMPAPMMPQQMVVPQQQPIPQPPPQPVQQQPMTAQQQTAITSPLPNIWSWKVTDSYQHMLMESVPFDGTPVLFMLKNESIFYIVSMVDGKKMVNGYSFSPLDTASPGNVEPQLTPEEQTEQRFSKIETGMAAIVEQLNKLVEGQQHHEPDNVVTKEASVTRQPIT